MFRLQQTLAAGAAAACLLLSACGEEPPPPSDTPVAARPQILLLNADILVMDGKHMRLDGAFAPEPVPDARCFAEATAAKQATRVAKSMVDRAQSVVVTPVGGVDRFNRAYVNLSLDGVDYGKTLIEAGLAAKDGRKRFEWCKPLSKSDARAPDLFSIYELQPGASGQP